MLKTKPTFQRGVNWWSDFAVHFTHVKDVLEVSEEEAKQALFLAIDGPVSRFIIARLNPDAEPCSSIFA